MSAIASVRRPVPVAAQHRKCRSAVGLTHGYTDEERDFIKAVDAFKRDNHRPFPTCCEILSLLKSLGYRKKEDN